VKWNSIRPDFTRNFKFESFSEWKKNNDATVLKKDLKETHDLCMALIQKINTFDPVTAELQELRDFASTVQCKMA